MPTNELQDRIIMRWDGEQYLLKKKKVSQRQLRPVVMELIPFWRFELARV